MSGATASTLAGRAGSLRRLALQGETDGLSSGGTAPCGSWSGPPRPATARGSGHHELVSSRSEVPPGGPRRSNRSASIGRPPWSPHLAADATPITSGIPWYRAALTGSAEPVATGGPGSGASNPARPGAPPAGYPERCGRERASTRGGPDGNPSTVCAPDHCVTIRTAVAQWKKMVVGS